MNQDRVESAVRRLAREIAGRHPRGTDVVLLGIQTGGVHLARQLALRLARSWKGAVPLGHLDVTMHRDDLDHRLAPTLHPTFVPFDVTGKVVVLVDDVLCSGRTTRAALDALHDLGRPRQVQLAVLVDRPHRELPIQADFAGARVRTVPGDRVDVRVIEHDGVERLFVERAPRPPTSRP